MPVAYAHVGVCVTGIIPDYYGRPNALTAREPTLSWFHATSSFLRAGSVAKSVSC